MRRKREEEKAENSVYDVNENILNIISPAGVDFDNMHTSLGENVGKIYSITRYPYSNDYGWLAPLCNLEGTSTTIEFHYTEPGPLIDIFDRRINEMEGNKGVLKNQSERDLNDKAIADLKKLVKKLSVEQEPVGYICILLHVQDTSEACLNERIKRVSSIVSIKGCNMKLLKYRQGKGLKVIAPYGIPEADVSNMGMRNMPISTFLGGFPMANPGLNDEGGYYLGKTTNNRLVILNMWLRGKDRTNSNWVIFGPPGIGKSTSLKDILLLEFAFGSRIIMFDPEEEYVELSGRPEINGDVINCAGGFNGRINPLQARKTAVVSEEDLDEGEDLADYLLFKREKPSDLALYIQQLRVFFTLYFGREQFTSGISAILEQSLIELYEDFHITMDTDVGSIPNDKWPIPEDLYKKIEEHSKNKEMSDYRKNNYEKLLDLLYSMAKGADSYLWNGYTTLQPDADFVDLVISSLLDADERVKRAQFYNIMSWAWTELSKNRNQKVLFGVDEGYLVVDPEYPDIMKYLRNMSKRLRKYEGGLMFITHSVVDVLDPSVKRYGQAMIDNACYKFIMGCDGKNLEEATKLFNLSESEVSLLSQKNRGQGIFFAGNTRLNLKIDVNSKFLEMMGKAGGR